MFAIARVPQVFVLLACLSLGRSECTDGQCAGRPPFEGDGDDGALVQLRAHKGAEAASAPDLNPTNPKLPVLIFGTAVTSFHNATIWVYEKAMVVLGYKVQVVWHYPHEKLYPMFTGHGGVDDGAGCTQEGCAELCEEQGLGDKSPCIDFVVDSNIPINHAKWLEAHTAIFNVIGTAYDPFYISLFTPKYSKFRTLTEAAKSQTVQKKIIGFKTGYENDCATFYCPVCGTGELDYIQGPPLGNNGFHYKAFRCDEFEEVMERKLKKKIEFIALMFTPNAWIARFPEMVAIDLQNYTYQIKPNSGKALLRKASAHKFSNKARAVLQGLFIGKDNVEQMDGWAHGWNNNPEKTNEPLCDYQSFNTACCEEAADKYIKMNQNFNDVGKKGTWPSYFW